ncbi:hypothetical protein SAMN05444405_11149 [Bacteroides luti]|uniref:Uncharacterized protein n=2 Tax=Bacteroides luti TaxID=1297750 RepID=A0A1M5D3A5_9BACE|nr:hypothetical protein SAMN05444405_11149 [Bacteroides luti]
MINLIVMKKILSIVILFIYSVALYAQKDVIQFLGIPVNGNKSVMIQKLKAKGYKSNPYNKDVLFGEFNGAKVNIHIVTNNNKVCRIIVCDANTMDESDIKIRFNNLCQQFQNNKKYIPASLSSPDFTISDDEKISYELLVNKKRYEAAYYQLPATVDSIFASKEMRSVLLSKYTEEQLSNQTEELQKDMIMTGFSYMMEKYSKKSVWFMINEDYGKYYISIFYDNEYNRANGEDL